LRKGSARRIAQRRQDHNKISAFFAVKTERPFRAARADDAVDQFSDDV
jgi:hypothetical protein